MNKLFKFKDLISWYYDKSSIPNELTNQTCPVLYRIHNSNSNKNYIGTSKYGILERLYGVRGHVSKGCIGNDTRCKGMYQEINCNPEYFNLILESESDDYNKILDLESEYIIRYDSVINGYNTNPYGKSGFSKGTICMTNDLTDVYSSPELVDRYKELGYRLGSCLHDHLKGTIYLTDGSSDKMIKPEDLDKFLDDNPSYHVGRILSPNKNKVWINNGVKSTLVDPDKIDEMKIRGFTNFGRIEGLRKKRGKYSSPKKTKVSNGDVCKYIPDTELDEFLSNNKDYKIGGKLKGRIIVHNGSEIRYINKSELDDYISKGYSLGRK
jgi:hypothetical protein